jgi:hypothetical protein
MCKREVAFAAAGRLIAAAIRCALGLGAWAAVAFPAKPASATEPDKLVKAVKVLPDKAVDASSLKTIVACVTRGCQSNDDKMIAIDNFMRISHYHRAYPPGGPALLWFNNYGWSLCGGLAGLQMSLYSQIPGWSWRGVGGDGHNMSEAKYDGAWHWVDCFMKSYVWRPDAGAPNGRTIASHDDIKKDPTLVTGVLVFDEAEKVVYAKNNRKEMIGGKLNWMAPALLVCGDDIPGVVWQAKKRHLGAESNTPDAAWKPEAYSAEVNLRPGWSLENTWDALATPEESWPIKDGLKVGHHCGNKDLRNDPAAGPVWEPYFEHVRSYWNGRLVFTPDFSSPAVLKSFGACQNVKLADGALVPEDATKPASVTVHVESPYVIVKINGTLAGDGVSVAGLKMDGSSFSTLVPGYNQLKQQVKIEIKKSLKALRLEAIVLNNAGVLPYLSPGKNKVAVSVADPKALGENKLIVTYAYAPGFRDKSFEELFKEGKRLFAQQNAHWEAQPTVVQKTYAAKDLPATFDIDVPTPKDKYPVYPRMLFVRREVVSPGGKPLPLPAGAAAPKMGPGDELKTLPNPYLIGTQPPPKATAAN